MCLHPIKIKSRSSHLNLNGSPTVIEVPCGTCEECRKTKHLSMLIRDCYEFLDTQTVNYGFTMFETLTYCEKYVPWAPKVHIRCFRYQDITKYVHSVRDILKQRGWQIDDVLRFHIASEYGTSENGTHRPHYHCLWFSKVPRHPITLKEFTPLDLKEASIRAWSVVIHDEQGKPLRNADGSPFTQPLGFTDCCHEHLKGRFNRSFETWDEVYACYNLSKPMLDSKVVHDTNALEYVAKYIGKDQEFESVLNEFKQRPYKLVVGSDDDGNPIFDPRLSACTENDVYHIEDFLKSCKPKYWTSKNFGTYAFKVWNLDNFFETGKVRIELKDFSFMGQPVFVTTMPYYYQQKLFYDLVKEPNIEKIRNFLTVDEIAAFDADKDSILTNSVWLNQPTSDKYRYRRVLNSDGYQFLLQHKLESTLDHIENHFNEVLLNIGTFVETVQSYSSKIGHDADLYCPKTRVIESSVTFDADDEIPFESHQTFKIEETVPFTSVTSALTYRIQTLLSGSSFETKHDFKVKRLLETYCDDIPKTDFKPYYDLSKRTLRDLAIYKLVYRNKLCFEHFEHFIKDKGKSKLKPIDYRLFYCLQYVKEPTTLTLDGIDSPIQTHIVPNLDFYRFNAYKNEQRHNLLTNSLHLSEIKPTLETYREDKSYDNPLFVTNGYYDSLLKFYEQIEPLDREYKYVSYDEEKHLALEDIVNSSVISQTSYACFQDFDELLHIFDVLDYGYSLAREKALVHKREEKRKYKQIRMKLGFKSF